MRTRTLALPIAAAVLLLTSCSSSHTASPDGGTPSSASSSAAPATSTPPAASATSTPASTATASASASAAASQIVADLAPLTAHLDPAQRAQVQQQVTSLLTGAGDQAQVRQACQALDSGPLGRAAVESAVRQRLAAAGAAPTGAQVTKLVDDARASVCHS